MKPTNDDAHISLTPELRRRALAICLRRKVTKVPQLASAMLFAMGELVDGTIEVEKALALCKMSNVILKAVELQERYGPGRADKALELTACNPGSAETDDQ